MRAGETYRVAPVADRLMVPLNQSVRLARLNLWQTLGAISVSMMRTLGVNMFAGNFKTNAGIFFVGFLRTQQTR